MAVLHMETDTTRAMAGAMRQISEQLRAQVQNIQHTAYYADWQGPNREEFVMEVGRVVQSFQAQLDVLPGLSQRVEFEVAEWENLDAKYTTELAGIIGAITAAGVAAGISVSGGITPPWHAGVHVTSVPPYNYAVFSKLAYSDNPKIPDDLKNQGWEVLTTAKGEGLDKGGYSGVAFINSRTGEVVIAHRGTDNFNPFGGNSDLDDDIALVRGKVPGQYDASRQFVEQVNQQLVGRPEFANAHLTHTGHSLGAVLADLNAVTDNSKGVGFDNPGSLQIIAKNPDVFTNADRTNLVSYQSNPNLVHAGGKNAGYVVQIVPEDPGNFKINLDDKSAASLFIPGGVAMEINKQFVQGLFQQTETRHSMDNILNSISSETGFPKGYFPPSAGEGNYGSHSLSEINKAQSTGAVRAPMCFEPPPLPKN